MSRRDWLPQSREGKLSQLLMESGDVVRTISKCKLFGLYSRAGLASMETNREALLRKLGDLKHAITAVERDLHE